MVMAFYIRYFRIPFSFSFLLSLSLHILLDILNGFIALFYQFIEHFSHILFIHLLFLMFVEVFFEHISTCCLVLFIPVGVPLARIFKVVPDDSVEKFRRSFVELEVVSVFSLDFRHLERLLDEVVGKAGVVVLRVGLGVDDKHLRVGLGRGDLGMRTEYCVRYEVGPQDGESVLEVF